MSPLTSLQPFTLTVPATSANLGPGFDSLGLAVGLYNRFTVAPAAADGVTFANTSSENTSDASTDPANSLFFHALDAYMQHRCPEQQRPKVHVSIEANIPLSRGLGSSSTVIVAGLHAASRLMGQHDTPLQLLPLATQLEGHPDNVAPALLGGVQLCMHGQPFALPWPAHWRVLFVVPQQPLSTHMARQVMPPHYPLGDVVTNLQACGLLVHALHTGDEAAMAMALTDRIHQPYRIPLIPGYDAINAIARQAGAIGTVISGAGSTVAVFVTQAQHSHVASALDQWIGTQTEKAYKRLDLPVLT
jgi:homoserine kinase